MNPFAESGGRMRGANAGLTQRRVECEQFYRSVFRREYTLCLAFPSYRPCRLHRKKAAASSSAAARPSVDLSPPAGRLLSRQRAAAPCLPARKEALSLSGLARCLRKTYPNESRECPAQRKMGATAPLQQHRAKVRSPVRLARPVLSPGTVMMVVFGE